MIKVTFIQFLRPNGRQEPITIELDDKVEPKVKAIRECGLRLTAEVLTTGHCSFCIEEPRLGDFDCELVPNGPQVPVKITEMLMRFDAKEFEKWRHEMGSE